MLKEAGVNIYRQRGNGTKQDDKFEIIELNNKNVKFIKSAKGIKSKKILICFDKKISNKHPVIYEANIVDNTSQDKKYESILSILKILNPILFLDIEISKFAQLRENLAKLKFEPMIESSRVSHY